METYITVSFWLAVVVIVLKAIQMTATKYPRVETTSLGADTVTMIAQIAFAVWAGSLIY